MRPKISIFIVGVISIFLAFGGFYLPKVESATGIPRIISYQGRLADADGDLLGGSGGTNFFFKFSIWDSPTSSPISGNQLWPASSSSITTSSVVSGVFNVNIGDTANGYPDTLNYDFFTNSDVYLQVEVSSNGSGFETLSPRQRIAASGFAINADTVSGKLRASSTSDYTFNVVNDNSTGVANLSTEGQVQIGGFSAAPTSIGGGSIYYNTANGGLFVWDAATSTPQWVSLGGGSGGSTDLQGAYNLGNIIQTTSNRNILFTLAPAATSSSFVVNISATSTGVFQIQASSTPIFTISQTNASSSAALSWNIQGVTTLSTTTINALLTANIVSSTNAFFTVATTTGNFSVQGTASSTNAFFLNATTTGQSSLGTVVQGAWNGSTITPTYGGT
ncbi:MAG: hypothetical protein AAB617_02715, partial [Patescibacteria group bacterium]